MVVCGGVSALEQYLLFNADIDGIIRALVVAVEYSNKFCSLSQITEVYSNNV